MSDGGSPKADKPQIPVSPIVAAAQQSIAQLLTAASDAMARDAGALLDTNGAAKTPPAKSVAALTVDMIAMLAARLQAILPKPAGTKTPPGADTP